MPISNQAASLAPDDDRVWLGRANLAIRTGAYDEAKRWLDACLKRRPEDVPVWRAPAELGHRDQSTRRRATGTQTPAGRGFDFGPGPSAESLARRQAGVISPSSARNWSTSWRKIPPIGRLSTGSPNWRRKRRQPAQAAELMRKKAEIDRLRGSLRETVRSEPAHSRRGGDGQPGRATRPQVRGPSLSHRGDLGRARTR